MKLTQVAITNNRYFHNFKRDSDSVIVSAITTKESYDALADSASIKPTLPQTAYVWSAAKIGFDTPTGELIDGLYATQVNSFHWVKIPSYAVIKIDPVYIKNNNLSPAGEAEVMESSVAEK